MQHHFEFEAIGTQWLVDLYEDPTFETADALLLRVRKLIEVFDKNYSRFRMDSLVTAMATKAGTYHLPDDAKPLFDIYHKLYRLTDGAMTPLIGQTISDAGYDADYSLKAGPLISPPSWDEAMDYSYPTLTLKKPALLDLGAAGKGYLVDLVSNMLQEAGVLAFCVDAGGDMLHRNESVLRVGLEHPDDTTQAIGVVELSNKSLCGSAGNRRTWAGYHHILNPHSLVSPDTVKAVWVVADTALVADALTTALFFIDPDRLLTAFSFEYAIVDADNSMRASAAFPAEFFT